jgi:hypothetical protein
VSAPVPAGLTDGLAALIAAFAAGQPAHEAMRGATVTAVEIDALTTFLWEAVDIATTAA